MFGLIKVTGRFESHDHYKTKKSTNLSLECRFFFSLDVKQPSILDALSKPKPASRAPAAKNVPSFDSSDSEIEKKAPVTKQKPVLKRKKNLSDDSDSSSSDDLMSRLKSKTTAGTKVSFYTEHSFSIYVLRHKM